MRRHGFDAAPLLAQLELAAREHVAEPQFLDSPVATMADLLGVRPRTIHRWRHGGRVDLHRADAFALALGLHPALLWPDWSLA